jgi:hypothetical protein
VGAAKFNKQLFKLEGRELFMDAGQKDTPLKTIPTRVELNKLKLDLGNVRFQHLERKIDEKAMEELIWNAPDTRELYEQIKAAKQLYEKPVIDSNLVVVEGNRRIVCLRKLRGKVRLGQLPGTEQDAFKFVDCDMIPKDTPLVKVKLYLAAVHVSGRHPWPTFNKAKQIYDLHTQEGLSYDQLAKHLGMGKITVIRVCTVYEETLHYGNRYPEDREWYRKFTYFEELFRRRDLKQFRKLKENVNKFAEWVHSGNFKDSHDVRVLGQIIKDADAMRAFENEGINAALALLQEKDPALKSKEFKQISKLISLIHTFPRREIIRTVNDPSRLRLIKQLKSEVDALLDDIKLLTKDESA